MAIERVDLSGSPNVNETAPVTSTRAAQNQASPGGKQSELRRHSPPAEKDPAERDSAEVDSAGEGSSEKDSAEEGSAENNPVEKASGEEPSAARDADLVDVNTDRPPHRIDSLA